MVILTVVLVLAAVFLLVRCVRYKMEIRSLCRQLDELARGSHMDLFVNRKDKTFVAFCSKLNQVMEQSRRKELQYNKAQQKLKQNISALAHDIRTPLTSAAGYLQMGSECPDGEKRLRYLTVSKKRLEELKDMLEELFLYTKLSSEEYQVVQKPLQVLPVLSECLVGMYGQFEEKGVAPEVEFEEEGFRIMANEELLMRIFRNLIHNALLHGNGGITIRQSRRTLAFENPVVKDCRIDASQIFDRFYKADGARRTGSSGLGLSIVKELVEKIGGRIDAAVYGNTLVICMTFTETATENEYAAAQYVDSLNHS